MFLMSVYLIASFNAILSSINVDKTQRKVYNGSMVSMFWKINKASSSDYNIVCFVKENGEFKGVIAGMLEPEMIILLKIGKRIFGDRLHGDLSPRKNLEEITLNLTIANVNLKDQNEYRCKYGNDDATTRLTVLAKLNTPMPLMKTLQVTDKETIVNITICGNPKPVVEWYFEDQKYDSISRPQNLGCYSFEQIFNTPAQTLCGHKVKYNAQNSVSTITGSTKLMFDLKPVPPTKVNVLKTSTNCFHIAWQNPNIGYCTELIITQVKLINLKLATEAVHNTSSDNMDLCILDKTESYTILIRSLLNNKESVWVSGKIKKDEKNSPYRVLIIIFSAIAMVCLMMLFGICWFRWVKSREFTKKPSDQTNGQARYGSSENLNQPSDESMSPLMNSCDGSNFPQNGAMANIDDIYEIMSSSNPHGLQAEENKDLMTYSKLDRSDRYVPLPTPSQDKHYGNKEVIKEVNDSQTYDSLNRQPGAIINEENNPKFSTLPPVPSDTNDSDYENTPEPHVLKTDSKPTINSSKPMLSQSKPVTKPAIIPKPKNSTPESTQPKDNSTYDIVPRSKTLSNAEKPLPPDIIPTSPVWKTENSVHGKEYQPNLRRNIPSQNTFKLSEKKVNISDKEPTEDNKYQIPPKHKRANTDPSKKFSNPRQAIFNTKNSNPNLTEEDQYQVPNQKRSYTDPSKKSPNSKPFLSNMKNSNPNLTEDSEYQVPNQTNSNNDPPQRKNTERYKKPNNLSTSRDNLNENKAPNTLPNSKFGNFTFPNNGNNMLDNSNDKFETSDSSAVEESKYNVPSHLLNNSSTSLTQDDIYENVRRS